VQSPRNHVPRVLNLATIRPCEQLEAFGPLPARLKRYPSGRNLIEVGYLHLALLERARLVRGIQTIGLDGLCMGYATPFPFSRFSQRDDTYPAILMNLNRHHSKRLFGKGEG
jgi:hypothetical protein